MVPRWIIDPKADKPAEQQVEFDPRLLSPASPAAGDLPGPAAPGLVAEKVAANLVVPAHRHPPSPFKRITLHKFGQPCFKSLLGDRRWGNIIF
jgi:hypothetical protein